MRLTRGLTRRLGERVAASLADARRAARRAALRLRARAAARLPRAAAAPPSAVRLEEVRRRLELLLAGLYGRDVRVEAVQGAPRRGVLRRIVDGTPRDARSHAAAPVVDGDHVRLPASLDARAAGGVDAALAEFRLLAIEQGERLARGTAEHAPASRDTPDGGGRAALERDLYLLCEGAAVDRAIAGRMRGMAPALRRAREAALAARPPLDSLRPAERAVETLVRRALAHDPAAAADPPRRDATHDATHDATLGGTLDAIPAAPSPAESLAWARAAAERLCATRPVRARDYRGLPPVALWGTVRSGGSAAPRGPTAEDRGGRLPIGGSRGASASPGAGSVPIDSPYATSPSEAETPHGAPSRAAGASALPRTHLDPTDAASGVVDLDAATAGGGGAEPGASGIPYPEWDHALGRLVPGRATVLVGAAREGDGEWAARTLREHAALVNRVRQRFERLRSRRARLTAQREGEELDLDACVRAAADLRAGGDHDDRLYVAVRPARRALAIALLVDVSGSTDAAVDGGRSVLEIEREAVLLASQALDALGDRYAVLAFSSRGARAVRVTTVKDFDESCGEPMRRRLAGLAAGANTRLGAAVRHATALLERQPAGHRLLLVLSDGKPNDTDGYHDRYAVEDARAAVLEARARGVYPFCLTVETEEPEYLSHVFGTAGHTILRRAEQLPKALVGVVKHLLGGR